MYEVDITNEYLNKHKSIKDRCAHTLEERANACLTTWANQEVKKRVIEAKKDAKEQARERAEELDAEATKTLAELRGVLEATLSIDDRIDWQAERDTRGFDAFSFPSPPSQQRVKELALTPKPGLAWLFRTRFERWQNECAKATAEHDRSIVQAHQEWEVSVQAHNASMDKAQREHAAAEHHFLQEQSRVNAALDEFRKNFEAGVPSSIIEYCERVFELSQYPDELSLDYSVKYDEESKHLEVELDIPPLADVPTVSGYKFISSGNRVEPVSLKKKEAKELYESVLDQIILRTIHEVFEGCYIPHVEGVLVNGRVTSINPATGLAERLLVRSVVSDRATFEAFDLSNIDPAACIVGLAQDVGQISRSGPT